MSWELCLYFSTCVLILLPGTHCEVWASKFSYLHGLKDVVLPGKACLYGNIMWSLAQAQQQSSIGLSQPFPSKRPWTGFSFTVQKRPVPGSSGASLAKRPYLESETETHAGGKKSAGGSVSASSADAGKKGGLWGSVLLMYCSPQPPHHSHLWFFRLVCFPIFGSVEKHYF